MMQTASITVKVALAIVFGRKELRLPVYNLYIKKWTWDWREGVAMYLILLPVAHFFYWDSTSQKFCKLSKNSTTNLGSSTENTWGYGSISHSNHNRLRLMSASEGDVTHCLNLCFIREGQKVEHIGWKNKGTKQLSKTGTNDHTWKHSCLLSESWPNSFMKDVGL